MRWVLVLLLLGGCSAERQIATSSTGISALAHSSRGRFVDIVEQADSTKPDIIIIRETAKAGIGEQGEIIEAVSAIVASLPGVADTSPWWADLIARVLVLIALIGVAVVVIKSGILALVAAWMLRWRPKDKRDRDG